MPIDVMQGPSAVIPVRNLSFQQPAAGSKIDAPRAAFASDIQALGGDTVKAREWWRVVSMRYGEPQRKYHRLMHLTKMLEVLGRVTDRLHEPRTVRLAVYFHDVVYDPKRHDNEEKSIELFREMARDLAIDKAIEERVSEYIRCTIAHQPSLSETDLLYFLDADLEVLSRPADEYARYAAQIRQEYAHVAEPAYRAGRADILRRFLQRERLYFSNAFGARDDANARANLNREIAQLESI